MAWRSSEGSVPWLSVTGIALILALIAGLTVWQARAESFDQHWTLPVEQAGAMLKPSELSVGDINGDGRDDLLVATGQDSGSEPLAVYWGLSPDSVPGHRFAPFDKSTAWFGPSAQYHGACLADVNGDGCLDGVVSMGGIGVAQAHRLFLNAPATGDDGQQCSGFQTAPFNLALPDLPPHEAFRGIDCDFGDLDGDGDFDLLVSLSVALPGFVAGGSQNPGPYTRGVIAVYENVNGSYAGNIWQNQESGNRHSMEVMFADANLDGELDIISSSQGVRVYLGQDGTLPTGSTWHWATDPNAFTKGIDAAPVSGSTASLLIAVAGNNWVGNQALPFGFHRLLQFCQDGSLCKQWQSPLPGKGDDVVLAVLDDDDDVDLLAVRWQSGSVTDHQRGQVFWDPLTGSSSTFSLSDLAGEAILAQSALAWVFDRTGLTSESYSTVVQPGQNVITFTGESSRGVHLAVSDVLSANGPVDYNYLPGDHWLTIAREFDAPTELTLTLMRSPAADVVIGDGDGFVHFFRNGAR